MIADPVHLTDQQVGDLMAFLFALTSPTAQQGCELIPESVPSGLPLDTAPNGICK
jgi:cytochrome c peroxidase